MARAANGRNGIVAFGLVAVGAAFFGYPFYVTLSNQNRNRSFLKSDSALSPTSTMRGPYKYVVLHVHTTLD
jgi:hypothetical protein